MKGGESWTQTCTNVCLYVLAWANIAVCQLCRERKTFVEQSWWPELNVFGSMPWCSFPRHIFLPRPAQKNCCLNFWSMSLHPCSHRRRSLQVRLGKLSNRSMPLWTSVFFCGCGYFQMKELDRTTEAIVRMNERWRKLNANMHQCVPLRASMGQHCSLSAVQRKKDLCGTVMMARA